MMGARAVSEGVGRSSVPDWRALFEASLPLLEFAATRPDIVGEERTEAARRVLVRYYLARSIGPSVAKTRAP